MLVIRKRSKFTKSVTAGALAFAFGLSGTVAYLDATTQNDDIVYNKEQTSRTASSDDGVASSNSATPGSNTGDDKDVQNPQSPSSTIAPASTWSYTSNTSSVTPTIVAAPSSSGTLTDPSAPATGTDSGTSDITSPPDSTSQTDPLLPVVPIAVPIVDGTIY